MLEAEEWRFQLKDEHQLRQFICVYDEIGVDERKCVCERESGSEREREYTVSAPVTIIRFTVAPLWINFHLNGTVLWTSCHGNCTACAYKNKSSSVHRHFDIYGAIFPFFFKHL